MGGILAAEGKEARAGTGFLVPGASQQQAGGQASVQLERDGESECQQGCNFATAKCVDGGTPVSHHFCSSPSELSCSLDRKSVLGCDVQNLDAVPLVYQYTPENGLGRSAPMDYCPHYTIRYSNRTLTTA